MSHKIGRNDPCFCGSGKKYKSCCMNKIAAKPGSRKLTAKWLNAPQGPNLMERTFGNAITDAGKVFEPVKPAEDVKPANNE